MKTKLFLLVSLTALLAACSSPSSPDNGTSVAPTPTPPAQPAPSPTPAPPAASYPYNPNANAVQSNDSRVPYYGEWVWAVAFQSGDTFSGKMSISLKADETSTFKNMGGGASEWCLGDIVSCQYTGDIGLVGTFLDSGKSYLTATHYDASTDSVQWLGIDTDGKVGTEVKGAPTLSGVGQWVFSSSTKATVAFAMAQVSTNPPIKPKSASLAMQTPSSIGMAQVAQLSTSTFSAQQMNTLQARALAAASALVDNH